MTVEAAVVMLHSGVAYHTVMHAPGSPPAAAVIQYSRMAEERGADRMPTPKITVYTNVG
jgi:hypothetical protein